MLATVVLQYARVICPVYIRTGLLWETVELHWLNRFLSSLGSEKIQPVRVLHLPVADVYLQHWSVTGVSVPGHQSADNEVYLPGRNLLLLCKAGLFCALNEIPAIVLGTLRGNPFPDSTPEFFARFAGIASLAMNYSLQVYAPFATFSKEEVVQFGRDLPLHFSFSCIHPAGLVHCGVCNKCAERRRSFLSAGVPDRTVYDSLPTLFGEISS